MNGQICFSVPNAVYFCRPDVSRLQVPDFRRVYPFPGHGNVRALLHRVNQEEQILSVLDPVQIEYLFTVNLDLRRNAAAHGPIQHLQSAAAVVGLVALSRHKDRFALSHLSFRQSLACFPALEEIGPEFFGIHTEQRLNPLA